MKRFNGQTIQVLAGVVDWMRRKEAVHWVSRRVGKWHFWTAFSFRGPRPPGNGLLIRTSSPGTRCFRAAARTARFTCPEFYCTPIRGFDDGSWFEYHRPVSAFCRSFFLNSRKRVTLCFPLRIFTIPGGIILIRAISSFFFVFLRIRFWL